jgi:hypothetical protein
MYKSKKWARILPLVLLGLFSFSFLTLLLTPGKVLAAGETYQWVDKITITASGGRFKEATQLTKLSDSFTVAGRGFAIDTSGCQVGISITPNASDPSKGVVDASLPAGAFGSGCSSDILAQYTKNVTISNTGNAGKTPTSTEGTGVDSKKITVVAVVPSDQSFPGARDTIVLHKGQESGKVIERKTATTEFTAGTQKGFSVDFNNLSPGDTYTVCSNVLKKCTTFVKQPSSAATRITISGEGISKEDAARTCESEGGSLAWMLCPVLVLLDNGINFLTNGIESLLEVDESKYNDPSLVQTWRVLRNIALLLLIPMMLLMVIGTALEFGPFDAYTVKKALPRMFLAVLFITLSLFITQFFLNVSNVVGRGIEGLVLSASNSPDSLADSYSAAGGLLFSTVVAGGAAGGIAIVGAVGATGALLSMLGSLALVTFVGLLIGYLVLVIRELLILVLMIAAPLAILVWVFPDNDKLWKIWKTTFIALLMMFPIIMLLISSGKLFANVIGDSQNSFTAFFLKIIAYVAPFFFIPATFKYGLGAFSSVAGVMNDRSRGLFDRQRKKRAERGAFIRQKVGANTVARRADLTSRLQEQSSSSNNWVAKRGLRGLSRVTGGYNIQAQASAAQAAMSKEIRDQIDTGDDTEVRALTARNVNGEWKTLAGKTVNEASVMRARQRWGNDVYAQQAALSYEMRKANSEEEVRSIADNYGETAKSWGMSSNQATGAWIGSAFENQNQHLEYKNMRMNADTGKMEMSNSGYKSFVNEIYEKRGSYNMSQMGSNTFRELEEAYTTAKGSGDTQTATRVQAIAETFMSRYGGAQGGGGVAHVTDDGVPIPAGGGGGGTGGYQSSAQGAAHVSERVRQLAVKTGVYRPLSGSTDIHSASGPYEGPRQN